MKSYNNQYWLQIISILIVFNPLISVKAQIASDGSLSTQVTTPDHLNFTIEEGNRAGNNLFHSFSEFSIPTNGSAFFNNAPDITNIFTRITGGKISNLDGFLGANGNANLFFLNPQGVIFGPNANLGLGGSLVVTSAESLKFQDGTIFSVGLGGTAPLLSQSTPIGLQYGQNPGILVNQSTFAPSLPPPPSEPPTDVVSGDTIPFEGPPTDIPVIPVGLQLAEGKTIALLGGQISNEGGYINAPGGRIELGSLGSNSFVGLEPVTEGFRSNYQGVSNFDDITINQASVIDVSSTNPTLPSGNLQIQGKNIFLRERSQISAVTFNALAGGNLVLNASDSLEIAGNTTADFGDTQISTSTFDHGNGGNLIINTKRLIIRDGGALLTNTFGFLNPEAKGNSGDLTINSSESLEITGISATGNPSKLSVETQTQGQGGQININTPHLIIQDGGSISAETFAEGNGGTINLNAPTIEVTGAAINPLTNLVVPSSIKGNTQGAGNAGDIMIQADNLNVSNQGSISVSGTTTGASGNINITANQVNLDNFGSLRAETTSGDKGSINLNVAGDVNLRHNSNITAEATGNASGGNINLNTEFLIGLENSDIIANADLGSGGNIQIKATGIFLSPDSTITASSRFGVDGIVAIATPDVQLDSALAELKSSFIPADQIIASSCFSRQNADKGRFVVTGTGGLPYTPFDAVRGNYDLTTVENISGNEQSSNSTISKPNNAWQSGQPIQEAQGITVTSEGKIILGNSGQVSSLTKANELICP